MGSGVMGSGFIDGGVIVITESSPHGQHGDVGKHNLPEGCEQAPRSRVSLAVSFIIFVAISIPKYIHYVNHNAFHNQDTTECKEGI